MNRITAAGGFVNAVGRINGNLNLSRCVTVLVRAVHCEA
jgi:hypothetical protein